MDIHTHSHTHPGIPLYQGAAEEMFSWCVRRTTNTTILIPQTRDIPVIRWVWLVELSHVTPILDSDWLSWVKWILVSYIRSWKCFYYWTCYDHVTKIWLAELDNVLCSIVKTNLIGRLEEIIPKILPIILFLMDLPIISKTATYYSQCDYLNMENTTVLELP